MIYTIWGITLAALVLSLIKDRKKTREALQRAMKKLKGLAMPLLWTVALLAVLLYFLPGETIAALLSKGGGLPGLSIALILGSLATLPGFIAFPLGGILAVNNVPYMIISAFTASLMMVGIVTIPIEKQYFGLRAALLRNGISLLISLVVAVVTGVVFREIVP